MYGLILSCIKFYQAKFLIWLLPISFRILFSFCWKKIRIAVSFTFRTTTKKNPHKLFYICPSFYFYLPYFHKQTMYCFTVNILISQLLITCFHVFLKSIAPFRCFDWLAGSYILKFCCLFRSESLAEVQRRGKVLWRFPFHSASSAVVVHPL